MKPIKIGYKNSNGSIVMGQIIRIAETEFGFAGSLRYSGVFDDTYTIQSCKTIQEVKDIIDIA